jgi:quinol monooxygenase YgiN
MITRINQFESAKERSEELYFFLKSLGPYISGSKGCASFEVLRSTSSASSFVVLEKWADIDCHKLSLENFPKDKMQAAMPLFGAAPKGDYYAA